MDLGIPIWERGSPFPYGDWKVHDPRFHNMGITVWKRGLMRPHFHMGITVTIWGFDTHYHTGIPIWERDCHIPVWKWLITISIWGLKNSWLEKGTNGSPLPYGDPDMGTGIAISPYGNGKSPFPYGDWKVHDTRFHMVITVSKRGLMRPCFHMGTIKSLTHYHKVFLTIWEFRKNHHMKIINHLVSPFPYGDPTRMERGRGTKLFPFGDSP